jgi:hypothetical protein
MKSSISRPAFWLARDDRRDADQRITLFKRQRPHWCGDYWGSALGRHAHFAPDDARRTLCLDHLPCDGQCIPYYGGFSALKPLRKAAERSRRA